MSTALLPTMGRRLFVACAATALLALGGPACTKENTSQPANIPKEKNGSRGAGEVDLWSFFDLPAADPRSRELSGLAWDEEKHVLWAVQDKAPAIVSLIPDRDFRTWRFGELIAVDTDLAVDLEGIVVHRDGFYVASENGPHLLEVDRTGAFRAELALPTRFHDARANKSVESLTMSPDGKYLFTTTEAALERDGARATKALGTRVRILRIDRKTGATTAFAYETDCAPHEGGDWGIADLAATSDSHLFVLERGWTEGQGNTARIYETSLDTKASCTGIDQLPAAAPVLSKTLKVDLAKLVAKGLPAAKQPQPVPLLDNYEGLAVGPRLPNGRPTLMLVSDDNGNRNQVARVIVLAL